MAEGGLRRCPSGPANGQLICGRTVQLARSVRLYTAVMDVGRAAVGRPGLAGLHNITVHVCVLY